MTLTSCWLTTAASALICASALSRASAFSIPTNQHELAEQIKTDITGNMIWKSDNDEEVPSLTRPDFKSYSSSSKEHSQDLESLFSSFSNHHQDGELKKHLNSVLDQVKHEIHNVEHKLDGIIQDGKKKTMNWISEGLVEVDGMQFERHIHPSFPNYSLRLSTSKNQSLCDPNVKQHSGYLDIGDSKHLWFVFFESRSSPKDDPVLLWLNGGPGCSSSTGLLFELGPCTIKKDGSGTTNNPYSWTNKANMIFLDQPVSVGYSYSDDGGSPVNNTPQAAEDVYAFLQLFFKKFPEYSTQEFSLAAESYGGRYGPVIASTLANKNKALARSRYVGENAPKNINLSTLMLGNGLTSAKTQFGSVKEYACDGDYAIFDPESSTCKSLEQKSGVCQNLIEQCYKYDSRLTCTPAAIYCWSSLYGPAQQSGLNLYDVRKKCNRDEDKDGPLCYPAMQAIEKYMNLPDVKESFGVPDSVEFQSCNMQVNQNFMMQGDSMHDTSLLLPELIEDGMRLLVYAGEADFMCNAIGNERWVTDLETSYKEEFAKSNGTWFVKQAEKQHTSSKDPKQLGGWFKKAGKGAGNVAFVKAKDSGHMFPMDQPEAASDMVSRWLANESFE